MNLPESKKELFTKEELRQYWQTLRDRKYIGYIWMSDAPLKNKLNDEELPSWDDIHENNNFIWEANLYEKDKLSLSIKQVNNQWLVSEINWEITLEENQGELIENVYLSTGLKGEKNILVKEAWLIEKDEYCCNMEVLKPAWKAFCGFQK